MDKDNFVIIFSNNLKTNIDKNFKTQKEFAELINESPKVIGDWCKGNSMPDLFKIYNICKSMGITVDELISAEPETITSMASIDYTLFNEVVNLTNDFAKSIKITPTGKHYLSVYKSLTNLKKANPKLKTKELFNLITPTLEGWGG